jgi:phenylacetate-CoA ligase
MGSVPSRILLAEFLSRYPEFVFDLEEYVQSTKYVDFLQHRLGSFIETHRREISGEDEERGLLRAFSKRILPAVPAYKKYKEVSTLADLPFIDKNTLRSDHDDFVSPLFQPQEVWRKETSGTTGPPVPILYSPTFYFDLLLLPIRKIAIVADRRDVGRHPVFAVAITDNQSCNDFVVPDPTDEVGFLLQVVINENDPTTLDRLFRLMEELRPACITVKPSILEVLNRHMTENGIAVDFVPDLIISSGAHLDERLRARSEELFRTMVVNAYGMTEFGLIASECVNKDGLHIDRSALLCEIVDSSGASVSPGEEGELTLSSTANEAMPLLRYRTGDLARFETGPCACGLAGWRIRQLEGRRVSCFRFPSGELFSPTRFNDLFARFPLREFQISQVALQQIQVLVEFQPEPVEVDSQLSKIKSYVQLSLPSSVQVLIDQTKFSRDSKFERYRTVI